jgi:hypothetical protein
VVETFHHVETQEEMNLFLKCIDYTTDFGLRHLARYPGTSDAAEPTYYPKFKKILTTFNNHACADRQQRIRYKTLAHLKAFFRRLKGEQSAELARGVGPVQISMQQFHDAPQGTLGRRAPVMIFGGVGRHRRGLPDEVFQTRPSRPVEALGAEPTPPT